MDSSHPNSDFLTNKSHIVFIMLPIIFFILVIAIFIFLDFDQMKSLFRETSPKVIALVGHEQIYQSDLDIELANYPDDQSHNLEKRLLDKIATDSMILQAAQSEKIASLEATIYNSPKKDYFRRMTMVSFIKQAVTQTSTSIKGTVIFIWFHNTQPGSVGLEEGKKIAFAKIEPLYQQVKTGKITIKQAAEKIRSDTTLIQVDPAYYANTSLDFSATIDQKITFDPDFNNLLWKLNPGSITPLYLAKDTDPKTKTTIEAVYMFGQVTEKISKGSQENFNNWLNKYQRRYELIVY